MHTASSCYDCLGFACMRGLGTNSPSTERVEDNLVTGLGAKINTTLTSVLPFKSSCCFLDVYSPADESKRKGRIECQLYEVVELSMFSLEPHESTVPEAVSF